MTFIKYCLTDFKIPPLSEKSLFFFQNSLKESFFFSEDQHQLSS